MKLTDYLKTRDGALKENSFSRPTIGILALVILVLVFSLAQQKTTVVLVPPTLTESTKVGSNTASEQAQVAWGMFLTSLLGNVTPKSSEFLAENISRHLSPRMYAPVLKSIETQVETIQKQRVSLSFAPTVARFDGESQKVIITGELVIRGLRGQEQREVRTYELGFITTNYAVMLDSMKVSEGRYDRANFAPDEASGSEQG